MFEDATKTSGATDRMELREITELLEETFLSAPAAAAPQRVAT